MFLENHRKLILLQIVCDATLWLHNLQGMFFFCINCNLANFWKIVLQGLFPVMGAKGSYNDSTLLTSSSKNAGNSQEAPVIVH